MILKRNIFDRLLKQRTSSQVSVLVGARQVGKSTLLNELQSTIEVPTRYLNLENPLHLKIFAQGYNSFIKEVPEDVVFIDEFHYYANITSVFKAVYDLNPGKKIFASGSSSIEIHSHLKESLAGRNRVNNIYPFAFNEWLHQFDIEVARPGVYESIEIQDRIRHLYREYLMYGAMPGLVTLQDDVEKRDYLFGIYQTYIAKDIKAFLKEESILGYNKAIEYLVVNNGQQLNMNTLSSLVDVSMRQIARQIEVMVGTYVIGLLKPLFTNKTKEIVKTPKVFFYDQGIANVIARDFRPYDARPDKGAILEQFVYWELVKSLDVRYSLHYWRTTDKQEVDFVLAKDRQYLPIEVKASWNKQSIPPGLKAFFKYYPETTHAVILTDCIDHEMRYHDKTIYFVPIYKSFYLKEMLT